MNLFFALLILGFLTAVNASATDANSGGETTVDASNRAAFSLPAKNLPMSRRLDFQVGNSFFRNPWVIAPSSTTARDGLGPLFNTNGCQNCHIRDGRGHAPEVNALNNVSMLLRLSLPNELGIKEQLTKYGVVPEPTYGDQLQDFAIPGVKPEGKIQITYTPINVTLADGETIALRKPSISITDLAYGELHPQTQFSARIAPAMIGLGLLAAIDEQTLVAMADPNDKNQDGISGKLNRVWDEQTQSTQLGRFGWKAGQPTLKQQNAAAFNGDLGITSALFPNENCTQQQRVCEQSPNGGHPEVAEHLLDQVTFYSHNLAVPKQRNSQDETVLKGRQQFIAADCADCHKMQLQTGDAAMPWLAQQTISPYTDLLLHDMGPGLADNRSEFLASGQEWRTAPLWGIGLTEVITGHASFLHDGRARTLLEAILWHGGEAEPARNAVVSMSKAERDQLIAFLNSL